MNVSCSIPQPLGPRRSQLPIVAIISIIITFILLGIATPASAQAGNVCEWTGPWSPTGSVLAPRTASFTRLNDGRVLAVGGSDAANNTTTAAEIYDPATRTWSATGSLAQGRAYHVAVLLADGRVLVAGGIQVVNGAFTGRLASAEIYDPAAGQFTPVASMSRARQDASAVRLADGRVLVSGGFGPTPYPYSAWLAEAEIFDPATGAFTPTGGMTTGRGLHTMTRLPNGRVLVTGGETNQGITNLAEVYDPATGAFTATGAMASARRYHTATLIDTRVIIAGGTSTSGILASTESYNPGTGTFSNYGSLQSPRTMHAATLLPSGKILITGGWNAGADLATAEISSGSGFESLPAMPDARSGHAAVVLDGDTVLVAGGRIGNGRVASAVLYDPLFAFAGRMSTARSNHTANFLMTGEVLIAGGMTAAAGLPPTTSAELYSPVTRSLVPVGSMAAPRYLHTATTLADGRVLIAGGFAAFNGPALATAEIYNPLTRTFTPAGAMSVARAYHTATLLPSGLVLITGGTTGTTRHASAELYDPAANAFVPTGTMFRDRTDHTATLLPTGRVLIAGGNSTGAGGITYSIELYDPAAGTFSTPDQSQWLWRNRMQHTATLLPNGEVLFAGGITQGLVPTRTAEIYNPWSGGFSPANDMGTARAAHAAVGVGLPDGQVMILGGTATFNGSSQRSVEIYDHATRTFRPGGTMQFQRSRLTATLLLDSSVLVAGGRNEYAIGGDTVEISKPTHCGPQITGMNPTSGIWGTPVTITGSQFGAPSNDSTVSFNGVLAPIYAWSDTQISTSVPHGATLGPVVVTVNGIASNGPTFRVGAPDLTITGITTSPAAPLTGQTVTVNVAVRNLGELPSGPFRVDFYKHSATPPPGWGDFNCQVADLAGGATTTCTGTVTYTQGTHSLWAVVDVPGAVAESNESNNVFGPQSLVVIAGRPDLVEASLSNPPATVVIGGSLTLTDTVRNAGQSAAPASVTRLLLSLDTTRSSNDHILVARSVPALAAGASHAMTLTVQTSATLQLSTYYVLACADETGVVTESNEANNCTASTTRVRVTAPDLVTVLVSEPPTEAVMGSMILVGDTVANTGSATAGVSTTRYYLSLDQGKGFGDLLLTGSRPVGSLPQGATSSGGVSVFVPKTMPANAYYLLACADDLQQVVESSNSNNCVASTTTMKILPPDIIISSASARRGQ